MTIVRLKGIKRYRHPKTGIWYTYHRKTGICLEPKHVFGSADFFTAFNAAEAKMKATAPVNGTWGAMMRSYKSSPEFSQLRDRTRSDYQKVFDWLRPIDLMPISVIDTTFVAKTRDKAFRQKGRRFANYVRSIMSVIFGHGIEIGMTKSNPVRDTKQVRKPTDAPIANRAWTSDEKEAVLHNLQAHLLPPVAIARWTGMREGDVLKLPTTAYQDGALNITTEKRGIPLWFPCPYPLRQILEAIPKHDGMRLCVSSRGTPWTQHGFSSSLRKDFSRLKKAGLIGEGLTFHGLRTSFGEEAADASFTTRQIADALAQKSTRSAEHYVRNIDRKKATKAISENLERTTSAHGVSTRLSTLQYKGARKNAKPLK